MTTGTLAPRRRMLLAMTIHQPDRVLVAPDISNMIPCRLTGKPFWEVYYFADPPLWQAYIDAAPDGGGVILSTGDQCGCDTPDENIFKLIEVAQTYGSYP